RQVAHGGAREHERAAGDLVVADRVACLVERRRRRDRAELEPGVAQQLVEPRGRQDRPEVEERVLRRVARAYGDGSVLADEARRRVRRRCLAARVLSQRAQLEDAVLAEQLNAVAEVDVKRVEKAELERARLLGVAARRRRVGRRQLSELVEIEKTAV